MSKKLLIINGPMGVGKSTIAKLLYKRINHSVWLDGDWCWMMNPFLVNEENKKMVEKNIHFLLRSFLTNSNFELVIFNWVIHQEAILDMILTGLCDLKFELYTISLVCSEQELLRRMRADQREDSVMERSLQLLRAYQDISTQKLDTTGLNADQAADMIAVMLGYQ